MSLNLATLMWVQGSLDIFGEFRYHMAATHHLSHVSVSAVHCHSHWNPARPGSRKKRGELFAHLQPSPVEPGHHASFANAKNRRGLRDSEMLHIAQDEDFSIHPV